MVRRVLKALGVLAALAVIAVAGGYLVLRRADIPYDVLERHYGNAQSRYVDLPGGVHMHYRDQGLRTGPTVLLIHGYSASLHAWEPWVAALGDRYRLVSIDLPGHGLTRAPADYRPSIERYVGAVAAFVDVQRLERFAIAGSSMGGNVAWEYVLAHPQGVAALILVDAAGWPNRARVSVRRPRFRRCSSNPSWGRCCAISTERRSCPMGFTAPSRIRRWSTIRWCGATST